MARLLICEDDESIAEPLRRALEREGHAVDSSASGEAALERLGDGPVDLLIVDVGLPGIGGAELCRVARERHPLLPVMMLTERTGQLDDVLGLEAGAHDYVTKPFTFAALLARVRALLRRGAPQPVGEVGGVRLDVAARRAWRDGRELALSPKEFDLLRLVLANAGEVVTRDRIMQEVWDEHWWGSTKTLDVHMGWLRRKLGEPTPITTVRGVGFRFEPTRAT